MGWISGIYYGTSLLEKMGIDVKAMKEKMAEKLQDFATDVVSKVPEEKINAKLANVEVDANLTADEQIEREQKVETFKEIVTAVGGEENKFENITAAVDAEPEKWGQLMKDVPSDALENMQTSIENGEKVNAMDVVKLAYGTTSGAVSDFVDKYADKEPAAETEAQSEGESKESGDKQSESHTMSQEDKINKATSYLDTSAESDVQFDK